MGITFATFKSLGAIPLAIEQFIICARGADTKSKVGLANCGLMSSKPQLCVERSSLAIDIISSGEVNAIPMDEDGESLKKCLKLVWHSPIFAANVGPISVKNLLNLLAMTALSVTSTLSIRKESTNTA